MENIREHYTFPIDEAVIVENVDNCIDERYHTIHFNSKDGVLEILMLGDGMSEDVFWKTLTKIAATTKIEERRGTSLGRYGWGMKISMSVADYVIIETKSNSFHGAQSWKLIDGIPKRKKEQPKKEFGENFTIVIIKLNAEYQTKITPDFIEGTLQQFYPTILRGTKVTNGYGKKRELKLFVNSNPVRPPSEVEYDKRVPLSAKVQGMEATGYVYLAKDKLNEEEQGIKIIVHGRKITKEFFGVYGSENERITGYLHADMLIEDLAGDKTSMRRNTSRWKKLGESVARQLGNFMKEIGAIREEKLPEKMFRRIQIEVNTLVRYFPELQELARRAGISFTGDVLIAKQGGDVAAKLEEGADLQRGTEVGTGGGAGVPVGPGGESHKAASSEPGEEKAVKERRRKGGLNIISRPEPIMKEAWFSPEGIIVVNSLFPTYRKAEKMGSKEYHMMRCAIEALLNHAVKDGIIEKDKAESYSCEVFAKWGEL